MTSGNRRLDVWWRRSGFHGGVHSLLCRSVRQRPPHLANRSWSQFPDMFVCSVHSESILRHDRSWSQFPDTFVCSVHTESIMRHDRSWIQFLDMFVCSVYTESIIRHDRSWIQFPDTFVCSLYTESIIRFSSLTRLSALSLVNQQWDITRNSDICGLYLLPKVINNWPIRHYAPVTLKCFQWK